MRVFARKGTKKESWVLDYYVEVDGMLKRRQETFSKQETAEKAMWKRRLEIEEGKFLDKKQKKTPRISLREFANRYLEWSKANKRSWDRDELSVQHLVSFFGGRFLQHVSPLLIEKYKQDRKEKVSARTVNIELACLRHMFSKAVEWEIVKENPVRRVKFFKVNNQRTRFFSIEEFERLVAACPDHLKPLVIVGFNTGMRKAELLQLRWEDIDFPNGIIYVRDSKNGEGRQIPMNGTVKDTLIRQREVSTIEYVFVSPKGTRLIEPRTGYEWAMKRAGIKDANFHTLRHSFSSHLVMNGVDLKSVQELLGHKTFSMTLRYSHLSPAHKRDAVQVLDVTGQDHGEKMERKLA